MPNSAENTADGQHLPPKSTLLLVDDTPSNLVALEAVLSSPDYKLISVPSGEAALEILKTQHVDVILLDIQMPHLDGFETARRIKLLEHCRTTPIIFVTAVFNEDPFIKKGYEAGAVDYFTKPFDPDILKMKVAIYASFRQKEALLKEREKRIKETEELLVTGRKLSAILETLPVGVIIADSADRIVHANDAVLKIWKFMEPIENDSCGKFLEWWNRGGQITKESFNRVMKTGKGTHNEILEIKCFDGSVKTVLNSISPLHGQDSRMVGAVAVIRDITEHKKIEEDMEQRILKLVSIGYDFEHKSRAADGAPSQY